MPSSSLTHSQRLRRLVIIGAASLTLLLGIIALVWWTDNRQLQGLAAAVENGSGFGQSLRIERPGFAATTVRQQDDAQWRIVDPCELPTNAQRLQPLLDALRPAAHSYASSEVDLEAAGLITPEALLFLDEQRLALGGTDLSGERRYLQRGDRVEFVPEWLLSMVNGGLSAIAVLELFPQGLDALSLVPVPGEENTLPAMNPESLALWRSLSAQQIVSWPLPDTETAISTRQLIADSADQQTTLTLHDFQRFIAIRFENAACAYILSRTSLPDPLFP